MPSTAAHGRRHLVRDRCRPRPGSRAAAARPRRCRSPRARRGRRLASPDFATVSASDAPSCRSVAAIDERQHDRHARAGREPAAARDRLGPARPGAARLVVGAPVRPVEPRADLREHHRQQRDRHQRRDERDQHAAVAHRAQERQRQRDQREQADRDRDAAEDDGAPGGLHRPLHRLVAAAPVRALLAPARDDDQRVVDRHAEADQRDQELHDRRDVGDLGQPEQQQEGGHDRDDRHEDRDDRQERREHEGEHRERAERRRAWPRAARPGPSLSAPLSSNSASNPVRCTGCAGDGGALQRRAGRLLGLRVLAECRVRVGLRVDESRRLCGRRRRRTSCRPSRRRRRRASRAAPARAPCRPSRDRRARSASRPGCPAEASPPGRGATCCRRFRGSASRSSTLVSQPSLLGTENSGSSASVAGPDAATPAIVRTTQASTTVRLCARTQRVSEDNGTTSDVIAYVVRSLRNGKVYTTNRFPM